MSDQQDASKKPAGDDEFELRPLQRMNEDQNSSTETPAAPPEAAEAPAAEPIPAGMVACASCMRIRPEADVTAMPDGRLLCGECRAAHRRLHAREESRIAAAAKQGAWLDLSEQSAWTACVVVPVVGWAVFTLMMKFVRTAHTLPAGSALGDATVLLGLVLLQFVMVNAALAIGAMIFSGLDLPSVANRSWKILAVLCVDVAVFVWFASAWQSACLMIGYVVVIRPVMMMIGLVALLGLEILEGAVVTLIVWAVIWLSLISALTRGWFFWGIPGLG